MKKDKTQTVAEPKADTQPIVAPLDASKPLAEIVSYDDCYHVHDLTTGVLGPVCKMADAYPDTDPSHAIVDATGATVPGTLYKTIALTANAANRWWANKAKVDAAIAADNSYLLYWKDSKTFGPSSAISKTPNDKLVAYLSEADHAEYTAIVERARTAMAAAVATPAAPLTELERLELAVKRAKERYEAAQAAIAATPDTTDMEEVK